VVDFAVINMYYGNCRAEYLDHNGQNSAINARNQGTDVHVTMNKKWVNATCKFQDLSGAYDSNAEVGDIQFCRFVTEDGTVYEGGTGTVTSARNFSEDAVEPYEWGSGGNTMIRCKIPNEPLVAVPTQLSPADGTVFSHDPRYTTLVWSTAAGAAEYQVQTQYWDPYEEGSWQGYAGGTGVDTSFDFLFVGAQPGRWRVRAINADGVLGVWSPWWFFEYTI
jgi:hypothetical protein